MKGRKRAQLVGAALTAGMVLLGTAGAATPAYSAPDDSTRTPSTPGKQKPGDDKGGKRDQDDSSTKPGKPEKEKPEKDTEAPAAPRLGEATVAPKGAVELPVTAEKDAKVVVREDGGRVVGRTRATGSPQVLKWRTRHGEHEYSVTATDKAKNESDAATVTVDVDARAPKIRRFELTPGTADDSRSSMLLRTEGGAAYRLLVDREVVDEGTTEDGHLDQVLDLANGRHPVRIELVDEVGNRAVETRQLVVRIPELEVDAEVLSEVTDSVQVVRVEAMAGTTAVLAVPGQADLRFKLPKGKAEVELPLADGTYDDATVTVTDRQGRTGTVELPTVVVDTTPPDLSVSVDRAVAAEGRLDAEITADEDTVVDWELLDAGRVVESGKYVALGGPQALERDVEEGSYELEVTATDTFDRTTVDRVKVAVAADPMSASTIALLVLAALAVVGAAVGGTIAYLRHRRRTLGVVRKEKVRKVKGRKAKARVAEISREQEVAFAEASELWRRRHEALTTLLDIANGAAPVVPVLEGLEPLPDEQVLYMVGADLTDMMDSDRLDVTLGSADGELVVTTHRFAFVGPEQRRDWWLPLVEQLRHRDHRHTSIKLRDSDTRSWLEYDDPEVTRLYLDFAMAGQNGTRTAYVAGLAQGLRDHEMRRPTPPGQQPVRA
ncbi:hypothetical protein [Nocardioides caldifontis]|uniref:hypothetical protein n=1 Tax=Nocardioides caldifontis TaxID=2588938 RepID=UPI0011DF81EC|nr:hypothetical protein [Nocardioides caldifontis]